MKKVAFRSCRPSNDKIRGIPTSGPYAWWLIGVILAIDEMSAVSTADSASMSKVRQAAAVTPGGQAIGAGGVALLCRTPAARAGQRTSSPSPALVVAGHTRDHQCAQPS